MKIVSDTEHNTVKLCAVFKVSLITIKEVVLESLEKLVIVKNSIGRIGG